MPLPMYVLLETSSQEAVITTKMLKIDAVCEAVGSVVELSPLILARAHMWSLPWEEGEGKSAT